MSDLTAQLLLNGAWTNVPILVEDGATITRLRQNQNDRVDAGSCRVTLRNPDGIYSSRNPRSPYYGQLGKNTQMRVTVPSPNHLWIPGLGSWATTPDVAALDVTGDLDLRADIQPEAWDSTLGLPIADKYKVSTNEMSWAWWITPDRYARFRWSPDGTFASSFTITSSVPIPVPGDNRVRLRVTLIVNVSGGFEAGFWTATSMSGSWTSLGATYIGPPTSIYANTVPVRVGQQDPATGIKLDPYIGRFHAFQMRSGINGTIVANPDFTARPVGVASFADSAGRTWSFTGAAEIRDFDVRFHGEVAQWPIRWNVSGQKITAPLEASGIIRRLNRPKSPLRSPLYREATKATNLSLIVGYWPAEEDSEALSISSGIGGPPMSATVGLVSFAAQQSFPGSAALPSLQAGARLKANIPSTPSNGVLSFRCLADVPTAGFLNGSPIAEVGQTNTGGIAKWVLRTNVSGGLQLQGLALDNTVVLTTAFIGFDIRGKRQMLGFEVEQQGSNVHWAVFSRQVLPDLTVTEGGLDGLFTGAGTSIGRATQLIIGGDGDLVDGIFGHFMVGKSTALADNLNAAMVGNNGEPAGRRIARLCAELGVPLVTVGNLDGTTPMGPQKIATLLENLQSAGDADGGQLGEARTSLSLRYRTRTTIYNQLPRLTLTYGAAGESPDLGPEDEADDVVNDVTARRTGGSSARVVDETSPLSVQDKPAGVGRYDVEETVEVATDDQLDDVAGWMVHLGTWDEYRYPRVEIDIRKLNQYGKPALAAAAAALDGLDRLTILSPPSWLPPTPIDLLVQGSTETIKPGIRTINQNCTPAGPWDVATVDGTQRVAADGTVLAAVFAAGAMTLQVTGDWVTGDTTTNPTDFPLEVTVRAERIRISGISGSGTQTWTVAAGGRGLNGWTSAHPIGSPIDVADIAIVPL